MILACQCHKEGSKSQQCDKVTGQCQCKDRFTGQRCDRCKEGYGNVASGCRNCQCDLIGSFTPESCNGVTGQCHCKPGVGGQTCNQCLEYHYGFSTHGCQGKTIFGSLLELNGIAVYHQFWCKVARWEEIYRLFIGKIHCLLESALSRIFFMAIQRSSKGGHWVNMIQPLDKTSLIGPNWPSLATTWRNLPLEMLQFIQDFNNAAGTSSR